MLDLKDTFTGIIEDIVPDIGKLTGSTESGSVMDIEANADIIPTVIKALKRLDKQTINGVLQELLLRHENISFQHEDNRTPAEHLTMDALNVIFAGDIQHLYLLCAYVLKVNYENFFVKAPALFGKLIKDLQKKGKKTTPSTASWN